MKGQLFDEIFRAGRTILSFERVRVTAKKKGEMILNHEFQMW